jgi:hypothetical protein
MALFYPPVSRVIFAFLQAVSDCIPSFAGPVRLMLSGWLEEDPKDLF